MELISQCETEVQVLLLPDWGIRLGLARVPMVFRFGAGHGFVPLSHSGPDFGFGIAYDTTSVIIRLHILIYQLNLNW